MKTLDRLQRFRNLMPRRVRRILLVASPYDSFILERDGQLYHWIASESALDTNLRDVPSMTAVATGRRRSPRCAARASTS